MCERVCVGVCGGGSGRVCWCVCGGEVRVCVGVCMWVRILASTFVPVSVHVSVCVTASYVCMQIEYTYNTIYMHEHLRKAHQHHYRCHYTPNASVSAQQLEQAIVLNEQALPA